MNSAITYEQQVIEKAARSSRLDRVKIDLIAELFGTGSADVALDVARKRGEAFMRQMRAQSALPEPARGKVFSYEKSLAAVRGLVPKYSAETVADIFAAATGRAYESVLEDIKSQQP